MNKEDLNEFTMLANREIFNFHGERNTCIFSTAIVCEALKHFDFKAEPLRVSAAVFPDDKEKPGAILGCDCNGARMPATEPGNWRGHLVSLVEDKYIVDTTLDQVNKPGLSVTAKPVAIYLPETKWFDGDFDLPSTGNMRLFPGATVRYTKSKRQRGWKNASDFRPRIRKEVVARLVELNRWW